MLNPWNGLAIALGIVFAFWVAAVVFVYLVLKLVSIWNVYSHERTAKRFRAEYQRSLQQFQERIDPDEVSLWADMYRRKDKDKR